MNMLSKIVRSFQYAAKGVLTSFAGQRNIKIHLFFGMAAILLSVILKISRLEFLIILLMVFLVIILEMINTAVEKTVDMVSTEKNSKAGNIKDIMAGAVMLAAILSVITGVYIFVPYVYKILIN